MEIPEPPDLSLEIKRDPGLELGFLRLDEAGSPGPILDLLVDRQADELARLARACLLWASGPVDEQDLLRILERAFQRAIRRRDHYYGQTTLSAWLRWLTLQEARRWLWRKRLAPGRKTRAAPEIGENTSQAPDWSEVEDLPSSELDDRLALYLRFIDDLSTSEIAFILNEPAGRSRRRLERGWSDPSPGLSGEPAVPHPALEEWIRRHRNGELTDEPETWSGLQAHLMGCDACSRRYSEYVEALDGLKRRLDPEAAPLSPDSIRELKERLRGLAAAGPSWRERLGHLRLRETGWIILAVLATMLVARRLAVQSPQGGVPLYPPTPVPVEQAQPGRVPLIDPLSSDDEALVLNGAPHLSGDGRWLAFSSSDPSLVPGDINETSDIFLFDQRSGQLSLISRTSTAIQADGWSDTPDISADGRWVAFTSPSRNLAGGDIQSCARPGWPNWEVTGNCVNIYLYDRETGTTRLITRAFDGSRVDGSSFQPTLSADGRWLVFWSQASNLVRDDQELCGSINCVDIFVFDRMSGQITRVPVGRDPDDAAGNESLSLTADGRLVAFTLYAADRASIGMPFTTSAEAVIYDRARSVLEAVNLNSQGEMGDLGSSSPRLSADGRFVAFVSRAGNLVPEDANQRVDVFVRDRAAGTTERVSVSSEGSEGDDHSGLSRFGLSIWGEEIGFSSDGRFVVFSSTATNLSEAQGTACPPTSRICSNVLLHDRQTGQTELVVTDPRNNRRYLNPDISDDGRWIAYADLIFRCSTICGQIWIKDRQDNVTLHISEPEDLAERDYPRSIYQGTTPAWAPVSTLAGGRGSVRGLTFSPDGAFLAGAGDDQIIRVWQLGERDPVWALAGHQDVVTQLSFSPDGALLASLSLDGSVRIWRVADGSPLTMLDGFPGKVSSLAFSPDGTRLAVGTWRAVWIWRIDQDRLELFEKLDFLGSDTHSLAYSPDGRLLAVAPGDNTVWIRHNPDGEFVLRLGGHEARVKKVAFAPDGLALATASEDKMVNVWQLEERPDGTWHAAPEMRLVHGEWVTSLAFTPDGEQLLTGSLDSYLRLWNVPEVDAVQTLARGRRDAILNLAISPAGDDLAIATVNDLQIWRKVLDLAPDIPVPHFFQRSELDRFSIVETLLPVHPIFEDVNGRPDSAIYNLVDLQDLVPFRAWAPTWLPAGVEFAYGLYDPLADRHRVVLVYRQQSARQDEYFPATLSIELSPVHSYTPAEVGASARVEALQIAGSYGEHVRGDWISVRSSPLELIVPSMMNTWNWESGSFTQWLRWEADGLVIGLDYRVFELLPGELSLSLEDLIRMAESLQPVDG